MGWLVSLSVGLLVSCEGVDQPKEPENNLGLKIINNSCTPKGPAELACKLNKFLFLFQIGIFEPNVYLIYSTILLALNYCGLKLIDHIYINI